jgi:hypothetical protein
MTVETQEGDKDGGDANAPTENWRDALPDDIKGSASLAVFDDVGQMAKGFVELKSYQGNSLRIPGEDAGDDDRKQFVDKLLDKVPSVMLRPDFDNQDQSREFYRTLGMPAESSGYEMPELNDVPEGVNANSDKMDFFRGIAHEAGLSKGQFNQVMAKVIEHDLADAQGQLDEHKLAMEGLNSEWGMATKERLAATLDIAKKTKAPDSLVEALQKNQLPVDLVKWIHGLSVSIGSESNQIGTADDSIAGRMTPAEAQEKINEIYANKNHAFHRGDKAAMNKMLELVQSSNPSASTDVNDLRRGTSFS